jgi:Transcriptional regulators
MMNPFAKPLVSDNLTTKSIDALLGLIRSGTVKHGEKLPAQDELAKMLGISRTSLREALKELSYRGIIISRHGYGTFVADDMIGEAEVAAARRLIEPDMAMMAAERCGDGDLAMLRELLNRMAPHIETKAFEDFSDLDAEFHCAIAEICGNRALLRMFNALRDIMLHQQNIVQMIDGAMVRSHACHVEIFNAMARRDPVAAGQMMRKHMDDVYMTLQSAESA